MDWKTMLLNIVGPIVYALVEFWLGKTKKTKSASVIELAMNIWKRAFGKTGRRKK